MRCILASVTSASAFVALALVASSALADDDEPLPRPRPVPVDTRTGRPTLAAGIAYGRLFGSAEANVPLPSYASWGFLPTFTLSVPVSRHVAIEAWGAFGSFNNHTADCPTCTAKTWTAGLGASYHLLDGTPFDPWFSAGVGWQQTSLDNGYAIKLDYGGIVLPRLTVGSDYYPVKYIGFGPWLELQTGRFYSVSGASSAIIEKDIHSELAAGLRVVLSPFAF